MYGCMDVLTLHLSTSQLSRPSTHPRTPLVLTCKSTGNLKQSHTAETPFRSLESGGWVTPAAPSLLGEIQRCTSKGIGSLRTFYVWTLCPVVLCPYLCTPERFSGDWAQKEEKAIGGQRSGCCLVCLPAGLLMYQLCMVCTLLYCNLLHCTITCTYIYIYIY